MVNKEEGTALLLTQDELSTEDHPKVNYAKQNSFLAATLAVSCLCGAGIFISTDKVWCFEPEVSYREKYLLRFYVLIGGILSALLTGRAVDFFSRRSSVIFAALCWLLSAVFLSYLAILQTNSQSPIIEVSSKLLKSYQPSEFSHALINSSGKYIPVSQSLYVNINPLATKPASAYSLSSKPINGSKVSHDGMSSPCEHLKINSLSSSNLEVSELPLLPQIITSLLVGGASAASIVSVSVYVFEISRAGVRARYIAFSDFLCTVFGIFWPLINFNILILTAVACLPVIFLSLLLPLKVPSYLSLPSSPYHLLLKSIIQKRKLYEKNIAGNVVNGRTGKNCVHNLLNYFSYSSEKTPFSFTHIIKPPFYFPKNKIYDSNSRKNSASDSEDVSFCVNNIVKQSEMEVNRSQSAESQESSKECFEESPQSKVGIWDKEADVTDCCYSDYDDGLTFGSSKKDCEARKALSYLYGTPEGEDEAEAIHKEFLLDNGPDSQYKKESYFNMEMKNLHPITHTVLKLGFPLLIIHMCAIDFNDVATLTGAVMSKLHICGSAAETAVSMLKIICTALSMLLLDKIEHKRSLMCAAAVLASSSLLLSFLFPHVMPHVQDHPNTAAIIPLPTMYPLLPTPLPQLLHQREGIHLDDEWNDSHLFGESALHSYSESDSPVIWLTLISVISLIASGSILLVPLTRLCMLSAFPTCNRGSGIGFTFAIQYVIHLIIFFLPCAYFNSSFTLMFRSGACFASTILLLFFMRTKNQRQRCGLQIYSFDKKFNLFNGRICNMSIVNSTAV